MSDWDTTSKDDRARAIASGFDKGGPNLGWLKKVWDVISWPGNTISAALFKDREPEAADAGSSGRVRDNESLATNAAEFVHSARTGMSREEVEPLYADEVPELHAIWRKMLGLPEDGGMDQDFIEANRRYAQERGLPEIGDDVPVWLFREIAEER